MHKTENLPKHISVGVLINSNLVYSKIHSSYKGWGGVLCINRERYPQLIVNWRKSVTE